MPLMPKRVKYRKQQRGRIKGNACRVENGTHVEAVNLNYLIKVKIHAR